ncbi:Transposase, partial (plasmid) [Roseomonas mucosa]
MSAGLDMQSLPEDPEALRALLVATMARCEALTEERDALAARNEKLRHLLDKLQRMQFGRRSERLPEDQLQFAFEE